MTEATSRSAVAVDIVAAGLPETTLDHVVAVADLQSRTDRKYLLGHEQFRVLARSLLRQQHRVLEVDGLRTFNYESVYFDTPSLALYRAHQQGRRKRWKARTRTYLDSGMCMFEVKTQDARGSTVKDRLPYDLHHRGGLTTSAHEFLSATLERQYAVEAPVLVPTVTTRYHRTTFVDLIEGSRVTCDVRLEFSSRGRQVSGPDRVLVETKSHGQSPIDRMLSRLGVRPLSMSKYCLGTALLHPTLPANRWHRLLTHEFGHQRVV